MCTFPTSLRDEGSCEVSRQAEKDKNKTIPKIIAFGQEHRKPNNTSKTGKKEIKEIKEVKIDENLTIEIEIAEENKGKISRYLRRRIAARKNKVIDPHKIRV